MIGPYCIFCDRRCFVRIPVDTPDSMRAILREVAPGVSILATCRRGEAFERDRFGFGITEIAAAIEAAARAGVR